MALAWPSRFNFTDREVYVKHLLHRPVEITAVLKASFPVVWYKILFGSPKGLIEIWCGYIRNFCVFLLLYSDIWTCLYLYDKPEVRLLQRILEYFKWRMSFFLQIFNICAYIYVFLITLYCWNSWNVHFNTFFAISIFAIWVIHVPWYRNYLFYLSVLLVLRLDVLEYLKHHCWQEKFSNIRITSKDKGLPYLNYSCCLTTSSFLCARFYYENIWLERRLLHKSHTTANVSV